MRLGIRTNLRRLNARLEQYRLERERAIARARGMNSLITFGDSLTVGYGVSPPSAVWGAKLAAARGLTWINKALNGAMASDEGAISYGFVPVVGDIHIIDIGVNSQRVFSTDVTKRGYEAAMDRELMLTCAAPSRATLRPSGAVSFPAGTWTDIPLNPVGKYTTNNGAKAVATVSGTTVFVTVLFTDAPGNSESFTVKIDGTTYGPFTSATSGVNTSALGPVAPPAAFRFPSLAAGSHTVEVTNTGTSGKSFYLNSITGNTQASHPKVLVGNIARWTAAGYASFAPAFGGSDANIAAYNTMISGVVAEMVADGFDVTLIDLCSVINPATDLQGDGAHWTVATNDKVFNTFNAVLPPAHTYMPTTVSVREDGLPFVDIGGVLKQIVTL